MIQSQNLTKHFDTFHAVEDVNLDVQPGEVLALLGQNGGGKTTTIRMLTSILTPTSGWAKVAGYDVVQRPSQVRASVGVLTEMHGLYGRMTAHEYLDFFGQAYNLSAERRKQRANDLLEYFGLQIAAHRRAGEYSKGMRQKLALARALLHEPPVLLLDEPTSAMDPESAQLVREEIARLRSSQRTIIICTHNLQEAEMLADKIAIIYRGRIRASGSLAELRLQLLGLPQYQVKLSSPWNPSRSSALPAGVEILQQGEDGFRYQAQDPDTVNPLLVQSLLREGWGLVSLQPVHQSLEMLYLRVMARAVEESQ